jgi:hypothetical protein
VQFLGALIQLWQGGVLILLCAAIGHWKMSKPTYRELATNFTLWCKSVLLEEQISEREFNEMSIDEKLDILQDASATRSACSRRRPQPPSRLGLGVGR